jgi:alpha-glucosidase (family GH31 glycosyl hydrolase)
MEYLRYMYTKLYETYKFGGTVIRPLFFEFPNDPKCHDDYEHTFMVGDALKVSPVLTKQTTTEFATYFPEDSAFIDLNNYSKEIITSKGKQQALIISDETVNVHLRGGKIIPWQKYSNHESMTTSNLIKRAETTLLLYPDQNGLAEGTLYVDNDGKDKMDLF